MDLWKEMLPNVVIPVLIVIISPIISFIVANEGNKRKMGKEWRCKYRKSYLSNYICLLILSLLFVVLAPILGEVLLGLYIPNVEKDTLFKVGGLSIYIFFMVITNILFVKRGLLVSKKNSRLLEMVYINLTLADGLGVFSFLVLFPCLQNYVGILYLIFIVLEVIAFYLFEDKLYFQYSKAKIILDDNKEITEVDSSSIYTKGKWIIASFIERGKEKEIRVLQEKVQKIIYYQKQF